MYHLRFALALALSLRTLRSSADPSPSAPVAAACVPHEANLGGIGRVTVFAFTGPVFGGRVCATVANLGSDQFTARVADAQSAIDALVTAALTGGGDVSAPLGDASVTGAGPYVIAPGGVIPAFGADTAEQPRVVLAYAGQRTLLIATIADRARRSCEGAAHATRRVRRRRVRARRAARERPERRAVAAHGRRDGGAASVTTPSVLLIMKRS